MYLHLGSKTVVPKGSIIAVCDLDNTTCSRVTRNFLAGADKKGEVINVAEDLPKSFVLCAQGSKTSVYLSQLAPATLLRRNDARFGE